MVTNQQLPLQFHQFQTLTFSQFSTGVNSELVKQLKKAALGELDSPLYLWGNQGSGKSHLLQAACKLAGDQQRTVAYIPANLLVQHKTDVLEGLEHLHLICIDDLEQFENDLNWQEACLHLFNRIKDAGHQLIIASSFSPKNIALDLKDLKSRLAWGLSYRLEELTDAEKLILLQERAEQRGFEISQDVAEYLITRVDRNLKHLLNILEKLDQHSLAEQRRITIPFVRKLIESA